jgi:hypothetical protein
MYRNRNLNLNGAFSYNQLLVNGVDVAPSIKDNKKDISFIYNESLVTINNDNINNSYNVGAISALAGSSALAITDIQSTQNDVNAQVETLKAQIQQLIASNPSGGTVEENAT